MPDPPAPSARGMERALKRFPELQNVILGS
jgi:hypothetical protein